MFSFFVCVRRSTCSCVAQRLIARNRRNTKYGSSRRCAVQSQSDLLFAIQNCVVVAVHPGWVDTGQSRSLFVSVRRTTDLVCAFADMGRVGGGSPPISPKDAAAGVIEIAHTVVRSRSVCGHAIRVFKT